MTMEQSPRRSTPDDANAFANLNKAGGNGPGKRPTAGFSEAPSAFLPGPWLDLGEQKITNDADQSLAQRKRAVEDLLRDAGLTPSGNAGSSSAIATILPVGTPATRNHPASAQALRLKRCLDVTVSVLALFLLAPLLAGISIILVIQGGPILYRQTRIGHNRQRFTCLKFRSMRPNADQYLAGLLTRDARARDEWRRHQKLRDDPRVTTFGRLLRNSSLESDS